MQRGLIAGRSTLANSVDIDDAMAAALLEGDGDDPAAALFFDFAAAPPSVEQDLLRWLFESLEWPNGPLRFVRIPHQKNWWYIVIVGSTHV
eukprot:718961-Pyramimonas_sp.AAC.1